MSNHRALNDLKDLMPIVDITADLEHFKRQARKASDVLKALAHENRLLMLCLVAERERSVMEIETILSMRQPAVSQQLARLREDGLVTTRRDGKAIYYSLASEEVRQIMAVLYEIFCSDVPVPEIRKQSMPDGEKA
jgi:DNA-binding transcriptional ArsR family regulator